ncbi:MAG: ABC-type transport auxiliary lipoprotein family protein [Candidatus Puniceispirillales bacterium]
MTGSPFPRRRFLLAAAATGLLGGCAAPAQRLVETHYGLAPKLQPLDLGGRIMVVSRVNASGIFAGRPLIKRRGTAPINYEETRGKLWHSAPADLIQDSLVRAWNSASAKPVATAGNVTARGLRLDLSLNEFCYTETMAGRISLHARLIDDSRSALLDSHYEAEVSAQGSSLDDAVLAMEKALAEAADGLGRDITATLG